MRVLHAISGITRANGGPAIALAGLATAQVRAGLDTTIFSTWVDLPSEEIAAELRVKGVGVQLLGPCRNPMSRHPSLPTLLEEQIRAADIVHIHALWESVQHHAARLCRKLGKPYVITPHGMLDPWNMRTGSLKKRFYLALRLSGHLAHASAIHACSAIERSWLERLRLKPPVFVEPLGIDPCEFQTLPPPGTFSTRYPQLRDRPYVIFLGRIHQGKGWEYLIPAMARVQPASAMAVIAGPDSSGFRQRAEALAHQCGVADRILFTGALYGVDRLAALRDAELFVLPSCHENFSVASLEALACGTPAIVSDQVGMGDEITHAKVGQVVPLHSGDLSGVISNWLSRRGQRQAVSAAARQLALSRFSWKGIALRWADHYSRALKAARGA